MDLRLNQTKTIIFISIVFLISMSKPILTKGDEIKMMKNPLEKATFGGGCFWCLEAIFNRVEGVKNIQSGYAGGETKNPTYEELCSGETGHAEVIQLEFDPEIIPFEDLLEIFWIAHDPTTLNRQGADIGTQYRSIILPHNKSQKNVAELSKVSWNKKGKYSDPIITEISLLKTFYPAENYHQNYFQNNKTAGYCRLVISPKIKSLMDKNIIKPISGDSQ